jgi:DNA-binding CsgD family transcriptional regulator
MRTTKALRGAKKSLSSSGGPAALPWNEAAVTAFAEACAELVRCIDHADFAAPLAALLSRVARVRSVVMTMYDLGSPPRTLYHDVADENVSGNITLYVQGAFKLDPFFLACVIDKRCGVFRLREVAPDNFTRTPYFLTFYRRLRIGEEVGLIVPLRDGAGLVISLESGAADGKFAAAEVALLKAVFPLVLAAVTRQWGGELQRQPDRTAAAVTALFSSFGEGRLSRREQEVVRLILQGHSSLSIGETLGIAEGTVKIHRKHAYQKLGVSTQAQLFQRFMTPLIS